MVNIPTSLHGRNVQDMVPYLSCFTLIVFDVSIGKQDQKKIFLPHFCDFIPFNLSTFMVEMIWQKGNNKHFQKLLMLFLEVLKENKTVQNHCAFICLYFLSR
jgi:hypothetical protein